MHDCRKVLDQTKNHEIYLPFYIFIARHLAYCFKVSSILKKIQWLKKGHLKEIN